ncbi:MAG: hypothetical protein BJ554DRAFT_6820 [Olpidium bornovanus]|uniref:CCDC81 HU domain-containing protein n=1 Tax=Olpidium bornovanus TaxID=278681 RepID=A0A8H7ZX61_9FUNG|nr:MAG: hypothetical protein BJ554DRAFT_6820 [Olpidium bornovanus]
MGTPAAARATGTEWVPELAFAADPTNPGGGFFGAFLGCAFHPRSRLENRVCVSVPYVGRFVIGHPSPSGVDADPASYAAHFIPAQNFTKIPGLHGTRCNLINVAPTEPLNYSAIASTTAFTRDDVELGIKDIALGMFRVVKERDSAVFPLPGIGKIIFWHGQVRLKYDAAFCAAMNAPPPPPESAQEHRSS